MHVGAMTVLQMGRFRLDKQGARTGEVLAPTLRHAPLRVRRLAHRVRQVRPATNYRGVRYVEGGGLK